MPGCIAGLCSACQDFQGLFCRAGPSPASPLPVLGLQQGVFPSQAEEFAFVLVEFNDISCQTFLQSVWVYLNDRPALEHIHRSLSLVSWQACALTSSRTLVKMLSKIDSRTDPCSTTFVISIEVEYNPLPTSLWAWLPKLFLSHWVAHSYILKITEISSEVLVSWHKQAKFC